jgi:hypothetical protein
MEHKIMDLNKRAMEHLGKEQLYGYGTIDESQWKEESPERSICIKNTSPLPTFRTEHNTRRASVADNEYLR